MIPKKREDYTFDEGKGRPFDMPERGPIQKTTVERQKPVEINLNELNGEDGKTKVPKNFRPKRGYNFPSFVE